MKRQHNGSETGKRQMTGAEMVVQALIDAKPDAIFSSLFGADLAPAEGPPEAEAVFEALKNGSPGPETKSRIEFLLEDLERQGDPLAGLTEGGTLFLNSKLSEPDGIWASIPAYARAEIVARGINLGLNLGDDVTYSGTVSAAFEGTLFTRGRWDRFLEGDRGALGEGSLSEPDYSTPSRRS